MLKQLSVLCVLALALFMMTGQAVSQNYPILWEDHFDDDDPAALNNVGWIYYPEQDVAGQVVEQRDGALFVEAGSYGGLAGVGLVATNGLPQIVQDEDGNIDSATVALALEDKWSSPNQILTFQINFSRFASSNFFVGTRMPIDTSRGDSDPTEAPAYTLVLSPLQDAVMIGSYAGPLAALGFPDAWTFYSEPAAFDFDLEVFYWVKWYLNEGNYKVKVWEGDETDEPDEWLLEVVDPEPRVEGTYTMFAMMGLPPQPGEGDQFIIDDVVMRSSVEGGVAVEKGGALAKAKDFRLAQNYPNPFNPNTTISFSLSEANNAKLVIYNLNGQVIRTLVNEEMTAGGYNVEWDGRDNFNNPVSSGIYIYQLTSGNNHTSKRMVFMK